MKKFVLCIGVGVLLVLSSIAVSCDENKAEEGARDGASLTMLKGLKPLPLGTKQESYFELRLGPGELVGYVIASLEALGTKENPVYRYTTEMRNTFPNGAEMFATVNAKLRPNFEPIEIVVDRKLTEAGGEVKVMAQRAEIGSKEVKLSSVANGEKSTKILPLPQRPFIYGIEMLVQRLDFHERGQLILGEFDLSTGRAARLTFSSETAPDGTTSVVTRYANDAAGYEFWFDESDKLSRWGMPTYPILFLTSTKEAVEKVKASMNEK